MQVVRRSIFLLAMLCLLTACGFQLRGSGGNSLPSSWNNLHLMTTNPNSELSRELQSRLSANGVTWVDKAEALYSIKLGDEQFKQRNLSLNAQARAAEFQLTLSSAFTVFDEEGLEVIPLSKAAVVKQMENDPRNVLGKSEEIRILKSEMRTELIEQIVRRIGFYAATTQ
ncbi:MAG: LPS-assembly lipoprotein [Halioglobus sp.]|jgi:LPS-assembly lipoprotein